MKIDAKLFALAYEAVSTEETRYYLNGVHVEPHHEKGTILVSTDGQRMVVVYDETAEVEESAIVQLPKFALAECKRKAKWPQDKKRLIVDVAAKTATVVQDAVDKDGAVKDTQNIVTAHDVIIEGTYPNWRRPLPQGEMEPSMVGGFNSKLIEAFGKFGKAFDGGVYFLRQKGGGEGDPIMIRWSGVHHVFGVLMPMRIDAAMGAPGFMSLPAAD